MEVTNSNPLDVVNVRRKLRTGQLIEVPSPSSIVAYNKHMGGVDRNDQVKKYYHVRTKCRKSYKYFFWSVFEVAVANAHLSKMMMLSRSTGILRCFD